MTDPDGHDGASPILRISLLGGFQVAVGSRAVDDGHWRRRKVRHLIAMIALAPGCAIHREEALDRLWPDSELAAANNLYQTLHLARRALDTAMPSTGERIRLRGEMLSLAPDPPPWIDVAHFETAARHALGGGTGWLMRKHGLTIDNLLAVELVTADGRLVRASETENADLYWGVRGGGGNFGVVTAFEYRLRSVGPLVLAGPVIYTLDKAEAVLHNWAAFMATAPDDLTTFAVLLTVPPHAPFPEPLWGRQVLAVDTCYAGPIAEGEAVPKPLRAFGEPDLDLIGPMPFTVRQSMLDETGTSGMHYYDKSQFLRDIDAAIPALLARFPSVPSPRTHVILGAMGDGRGRGPGGAGGDGIRPPRRSVHPVDHRRLEPGGSGRPEHRVGAWHPRDCRSVRHGRGLRQSPGQRGDAVSPRRLSTRDLLPPGCPEGQVRPNRFLPPQPERRPVTPVMEPRFT